MQLKHNSITFSSIFPVIYNNTCHFPNYLLYLHTNVLLIIEDMQVPVHSPDNMPRFYFPTIHSPLSRSLPV